MVDTVRKKTHDKVDVMMDKADAWKRSGLESMAQATNQSKKMKLKVDGYIRKNPERSVLLAAGVGVIVGGMIAASLMRKAHMAHMERAEA